MKFLYDLSIYFLVAGIKIASLFNKKANDSISGRKNWRNKLKEALKNNHQKIIWFHISSLGEFEQARPLIIQIKTHYPQYKILITFFSPSGYNAQKNFQYADFVFYLPFDTPQNASDFLDIVQPSFVFFVKYEFWINFLIQLQKRKSHNLKCFLISSIFRKHQPFFKWYGKIFINALKTFDIIFVQDNLSIRLLKKIGFEKNIYLSGDTRVDRVVEIAQQHFSSAVIDNFVQQHKTIIAGSTWLNDEKILIPTLAQLKNHFSLKTIIAPHQPDDKNISNLIHLLNKYQLSHCKYTEVQNSSNISVTQYDVMIIDTIGILNKIYRYGYIAYIGGGFSDGIHNILEPAAYGLPVVFGKKYQKFYEATELIKNKGAFTISNENELLEKLYQLFNDEKIYFETQKSVKEFIYTHQGGVKKTMQVLEKYLK
ncbi:MAG: glycosyltransferase N-terminal domain-containing protein [Bacteroidota bacterium]